MKIAMVGAGYVGLVTGTCFADSGNDVTCLDIDPDKVEMLQNGNVPIYEPGLTELVRRNMAVGRLRFTNDVSIAIRPAEIVYLAVGTPQRDDGTYESTRRCWVRTVAPMPDDLLAHLGVAAFLSDMTGSAFRPHSLGEWGNHTDATIDHAVWFHRPLRTDEWVYTDFEALVNHAGRATVRARFHDRAGHLCLSMAQELLIRPLG